jgi:hypothetical protein
MIWCLYNCTYVDSSIIKQSFEFFVKNNKIFLDLENADLNINLHGRTILPSLLIVSITYWLHIYPIKEKISLL